MSLIQTEANNLIRDTSNMALINNNVKAFKAYKKTKLIQTEKDNKIESLENELKELKSIINLVLNS